jgi:hypothetical protein
MKNEDNLLNGTKIPLVLRLFAEPQAWSMADVGKALF